MLDFLVPEVILLDPQLDSKEPAIERMVRTLARHNDLGIEGEALVDSVRRREAQASTCLGGGLMVPHGVITARHSLLGVMAISEKGWAFPTPDDEPVHCIVLLATPKGAAAHHLAVLAALARLFLLAPELKGRLVAASSPNGVHEILASEEAGELNYAFERVGQKPEAKG